MASRYFDSRRADLKLHEIEMGCPTDEHICQDRERVAPFHNASERLQDREDLVLGCLQHNLDNFD